MADTTLVTDTEVDHEELLTEEDMALLVEDINELKAKGQKEKGSASPKMNYYFR